MASTRGMKNPKKAQIASDPRIDFACKWLIGQALKNLN